MSLHNYTHGICTWSVCMHETTAAKQNGDVLIAMA